jgi:hypothetical protein
LEVLALSVPASSYRNCISLTTLVALIVFVRAQDFVLDPTSTMIGTLLSGLALAGGAIAAPAYQRATNGSVQFSMCRGVASHDSQLTLSSRHQHCRV